MNTTTKPSNLQLRVITALIALPLTLFLLFWLPTLMLAGIVLLLLGVGLLEWARLSDAGTPMLVTLFAAYVLLGPGVFAARVYASIDLVTLLLVLAALFWCLALAMVLRFPASGRLLPPIPRGVTGAFVLACAWLAFTHLKQIGGEWLIVWLLSIVWIADSAAYFGGRRWGRRKLAPHVSPGKTIEGAFTGIVAAVIVAAPVGVLTADLFNFPQEAIFWVLASFGMVMLSILGDLFVSLLKRIAGAKDSGGLFPGHGGVLDRLDSLLPTMPVLALLFQLG